MLCSVVSHVRVSPLPVQGATDLCSSLGHRSLNEVKHIAGVLDHLSDFALKPDSPSHGPRVTGLAPALGVERGSVKEHAAPSSVLHDSGPLTDVAVLEVYQIRQPRFLGRGGEKCSAVWE